MRTVPRAATQQTHPYEAVWKALSYGLPEAPIILAALAYTHTDWLQSVLGRLAPFYPYAVFGAGVLLGWRFHRSRLLFALLLVTLADRTLLHFAVGQGLARHPVVLQAIGVLLPLNLAALLLGAERGVLTPPRRASGLPGSRRSTSPPPPSSSSSRWRKPPTACPTRTALPPSPPAAP